MLGTILGNITVNEIQRKCEYSSGGWEGKVEGERNKRKTLLAMAY